MNDFSSTPIENFVPHRKPMLLLDSLIGVSEDSAEASFLIDENCIFLKDDNTLEPVALIEIMAQCFAAGNGVLHPARFGYLASMRGIKIHGQVGLGDTVTAKVKLITKIGDIMVVEGMIYKAEQCVIEGQYKIFVPSQSPE